MTLVARAYPDPQFIDADGRVRADAVAIRTTQGDILAGELVLRLGGVFQTPARLDDALASMSYQRSSAWRRCAGTAGDEWEADVTPRTRHLSLVADQGADAHA